MGRVGSVIDEVWRDCPFGRGLYDVSNLGNVRSWNNNRWGRRATPHPLALHTNELGYKTVNLGRGVVKFVNRLVCEAFHGSPFDGAEAAHGDRDPGNNAATNLRWATPAENGADKVRHGTTRPGELHRDAKLTEAQVVEIRRRRRAGERNMDVAAAFGISPQSTSNINSGKKWRCVALGA